MNIPFRGPAAFLVLAATAACSPTPARSAQPPTAPPAALTAPAPAGSADAAVVPAGEPQDVEVTQLGNAFSPSKVVVKAGSAVRFLVSNQDPEAHNLVSLDTRYPLADNQQRSGGTFALDWLAPKGPGEYVIMCSFHPPNMRLRVIVQ